MNAYAHDQSRSMYARRHQSPAVQSAYRPARHAIGRVWGLAAALGIGVGVTLSTAGIACADPAGPDTTSVSNTSHSASSAVSRRHPAGRHPAAASSAADLPAPKIQRSSRSQAAAAAVTKVNKSATAATQRPEPSPVSTPADNAGMPSAASSPALSRKFTTAAVAALVPTASSVPPVAPVAVLEAAAAKVKPSVTAAAAVPAVTAAAAVPAVTAAAAVPAAVGATAAASSLNLVTAEISRISVAIRNLIDSFNFAASGLRSSAAASWKRQRFLPTISITDASLVEGTTGTANMGFTVALSKASTTPVTVNYATSNGTATAGTDYLAGTGTVNFAAGQTTQTINVGVIGDTTVEPTETLTVTLSAPTGATLSRTVATGNILNDDVAPRDPWGNSFFSPFVSMSNWPTPSLVQLSQANSSSLMIAGFIQVDSNGKPSWGGYSALEPTSTNSQAQAINKSIADFQAAGGNAMISFGGAVGTSLSQYYSANHLSAQALADAYAGIADTYKVNHLNFDIEGAALANQAAVTLDTQALHLLQQSRPDLKIWYTLPVGPNGFYADVNWALDTTLKAGVKLNGVNIMAMDYGAAFPTTSTTMGTYAIQAAQNAYSQLSALYTKYGQVYSWGQLGVTPMIGVNDVTNEVFTLADAQALEDFARTKGLGMLSMWSILRDNPGTLGSVSESTSGLSDPSGSFSNIFHDYGTTNPMTYL